jgi:hypothetical protein
LKSEERGAILKAYLDFVTCQALDVHIPSTSGLKRTSIYSLRDAYLPS